MKALIRYLLFYGTEAERQSFTPVQIHSGFFCEDTNKEYRWNGSSWILINGSGTGGMEIHGNEYHTPDYENANSNIQAHITSLHAPSGAQKNSDILKSEIEAKLTGTISSHSHAGGSLTLGEVYPIGSVYISVIATNPSILFGMGTWVQIAQGRVLVGQDPLDTNFDVTEETGGAKTHAHTYTQVPNHVHAQSMPTSFTGSQSYLATDTSTTGSKASPLSTGNPTGGVTQGTTDPGSNLMPYFVVYIWKRTA